MVDILDHRKAVNVSIAIILFIMAFIAPAFIIFPMKKGYISPVSVEIGTTPWALVTGGIGVLALAFIFLTFAIIEKKMRKVVLTIVLAVVAVIGIAFSIKDYYYITSTHFVSNGPFTFEEKIYEWEDFESVEEVLGREGGLKFVESINLKMKDGTQYQYKGGAMSRMYSTITNRVVDAGGEHIRTEPVE